MPRRQRGKFGSGFTIICWVHPIERWVIYGNGSTGRLPDDAVYRTDLEAWYWIEANATFSTPQNPAGEREILGKQFSPGRAGGHLWAVPIAGAVVQPAIYLLNDATGFSSPVIPYSYLQPGWAWTRRAPSLDEDSPDFKLRRAYWRLDGVLKPIVPDALVPFPLHRSYPEWPPTPGLGRPRRGR